jgi:RNA exonuclease 4
MSGLSSNWKKLQAELKAESGTKPAPKRKQTNDSEQPGKKQKINSLRESRTREVAYVKSKTSANKMGAAQSSLANAKERELGQKPTAFLWGKDISAEALAEAYQLGSKDNSMVLSSKNDRINHGLSKEIEIGKYIAIDCEMVGVGPGGHESVLARISIVDFHGRQIYDSYVKTKERVTDWRTPVSGISRKEMRFARDFEEVQQEMSDLLKDRVLIGHDIRHDLEALKLSHPPRDIRDTSKYQAFKKHAHGRKPALRILAQSLLGVDIQGGAHSSLEDARVTMLLFRKNKSGFDVDHANRYTPKPSAVIHGKPKKKKK